MIARSGAAQIVNQARRGMRRRAIEHELQAVVAGRADRLTFQLDEQGVDATALVLRAAAPLGADSAELRRLVAALKSSGALDRVVDGLAARDIDRRATSAALVGALRLEEAIPWLAPLLASRERTLVAAAARALGRIGGARSADTLIQAIQRAGPRRIFITELARSAPDLYIEAVLAGTRRPGVTPAAALAAGLRRRHTAVTPLLGLASTGNRRHRMIGCRALAWIGARTAIPLLETSLRDPDWRVRMSATKALAVLRARSARRDVETLLGDRHTRVRKTAQQALRRLEAG